ncbi:MAG TPA: hypothetical protein PKL77_06155 [Candidatus Omnitrophota bacterium]|nr:hypothetical protein [Candidatus Omnitrophota bacterium]
MIKTGTIVKIVSADKVFRFSKDIYNRYKTENCFPYFEKADFYVKNGDVGEVMAGAKYPPFEHAVYLVNIFKSSMNPDFVLRCIVVLEEGIVPVNMPEADNSDILSGLTETQKKDVENCISELKRANMKKKWSPAKGEAYYYIDARGAIRKARNTEENDDLVVKTGRYAKTEAECQAIIERDFVMEELRCYAAEHNEKDIDMFDEEQSKFNLACGPKEDKFYVYNRSCVLIQPAGTPLFTSKEVAEDAIKAVGEDRIRKYYFGVEE